jgi:hypothetical protein
MAFESAGVDEELHSSIYRLSLEGLMLKINSAS